MAARYDAGPRLTAFVPHCDGDTVIRVELLRDEAKGDYSPETLWTIQSADGFGSARWFVAGATKPGEESAADPEVTLLIEQTESESLGFKAYTAKGDWFEVWFGFDGNATDGRIPSNGSLTTGRIDPISGDKTSLAEFERTRCEGAAILTESGRAALAGGLGALAVVGVGILLRWRCRTHVKVA